MNKQSTNGLLAFEEDYLWVNENLETLLEQYANQWIAVEHWVYAYHVIFHSPR